MKDEGEMRRVGMVQEHALFHFRAAPNNATVAHNDVAADIRTLPDLARAANFSQVDEKRLHIWQGGFFRL